MIERRPFEQLGGADHGWLNAKHHFSFASYHDPSRMSWGALRVWNDDEIAPNSGFPPHPHSDMEIVTWVLSGTLAWLFNRYDGRTAFSELVREVMDGTVVVSDNLSVTLDARVAELDRLISDISDASRLDAELARAEARRVDMRKLMTTVVSVANERRRPKDATIQLDIETPTAEGDGPFAIVGHDSRLRAGSHFTDCSVASPNPARQDARRWPLPGTSRWCSTTCRAATPGRCRVT